MSKNKIVGIIILVLCIFVYGYSQNKNNEINKNNQINNVNNKENTDVGLNIRPNEEGIDDSPLLEEEYESLLIKNYEKYIKPLDLKEYDNLNKLLQTREEIDNTEFLNEFKTIINDNRVNLKSFERSMTDLNIKDLEIEEINNKIVKECEVYVEDLDMKESYLEVLGDNILSKPNNEFILYIEEILDREELEKNRFEEAIEEAEYLLEIQLEAKD